LADEDVEGVAVEGLNGVVVVKLNVDTALTILGGFCTTIISYIGFGFDSSTVGVGVGGF
jgi:hypothetical protein